MGKSKEAVSRTLEQVEAFVEEGRIGTYVHGALLVSLGVVERLAAHSEESMNAEFEPDDEVIWGDASDEWWNLEDVEYADRNRYRWRWAGGFEAAPDKQPLMYRTDRPKAEVPLCYVVAAVGPLVLMS